MTPPSPAEMRELTARIDVRHEERIRINCSLPLIYDDEWPALKHYALRGVEAEEGTKSNSDSFAASLLEDMLDFRTGERDAALARIGELERASRDTIEIWERHTIGTLQGACKYGDAFEPPTIHEVDDSISILKLYVKGSNADAD